MPMFRCTIPSRYQANCPGRTDPRARQGHYVEADNLIHAAVLLAKEENLEPQDIEVQEWRD